MGRFFAPGRASLGGLGGFARLSLVADAVPKVMRLRSHRLAVLDDVVMVRHDQVDLREEQADHADQAEEATHVDVS